MPHSAEDKRRAITRLNRIRGQADALARAVEVEAGTDCAPILQQLAAMRGAVHGLMADLLDSHLRETMARQPAPSQADIEEMLALLRSYLK
ncbi:metal/formaldehyde-sensitive transcriptional repressor [Comamonas odontotermitis]|uniref:metal/formaldehyde-sensitive transcriptional repressor n=1 Tax=Comamonas odontotermitis TaxID=379895 RepID=UPI00366B5471